MEHDVILVVQGADFESADTQAALSLIQAQVLGVKDQNTWLLATAEASFFAGEEKVARAAAADVAKMVPGAEAVAFESQDQVGGVRHHLVGDRWNPPAGLGAGMFSAGDEIAWFDEIANRAHEARKSRRQENKQAKQLVRQAAKEGRPLDGSPALTGVRSPMHSTSRPVLTKLDDAQQSQPSPTREPTQTIDGPSL